MFKLETHCHTSEGSKCGHITAEQQVIQYKNAGYDGIIITDHFVNGNSSVDRTLPWEEQMMIQFSGFKNAYNAGKKTGLKVFEGIEFAYNGTEFIVLGLGYEWFKNHPETKDMTPEEFLPLFRENGAAVIHVHPFREASYIPMQRLYPELVDAVEGVNLRNEYEWNVKALDYAKKHNLPVTAGSDSHRLGELGAGIEIDFEVNDLSEIVQMIKSGKGWKYIGAECYE